MSRSTSIATLVLLSAVVASPAAAVTIETVPVGNPGNPGELSGYGAGGSGPDRICGAVAYTYNIGKYEVTAGQYTAFLNAVAATDTYGLYNTQMAYGFDGVGCRILRSGSPGSYTYSVTPDAADRPVNFVDYWDACRFANWLHNGQPSSPQGTATTEAGAYTLNGYNGDDGREIQRNAGWTWAVTNEDEWYKAAYHKNDGVTANYWDYPMRSNDVPNNGNPGGDTGNTATFYDGDYTLGSPFWRTEAGFFSLSESPYGSFDQGGNVWEWNESAQEYTGYSSRGLRGGCYYDYDFNLLASHRDLNSPTNPSARLGFRVVQIPEPATIMMLALASAGVLRPSRSRKANSASCTRLAEPTSSRSIA